MPGEAAAQAIAQRIVDALAQPVRIGGIPLNGEASVGLAYAPTGADVEALIRNADTALYSAKAHGKGRWRQYHDGMVNPARHHIDARRRVEEALDNGWLAVHYQPIVELATGTPVGFEALVRLNDPRGNMAPAELIAVAEQTGLIERVGDFVLHQALTDARQLAAGDGRYIIANLSARQLRQSDFVARVRSQLAAAQVDPSSLVLEITENGFVADDDQAWSYRCRASRGRRPDSDR